MDKLVKKLKKDYEDAGSIEKEKINKRISLFKVI